MEFENRTGRTVWLGLYGLNDTAYTATYFPWGARKKLKPNERASFPARGAKTQVAYWTSGAFGSMLAKPKTLFTTAATISEDKNGFYVYNRLGPPTAKDKIDHFVVLMLENRSFDNLLGWLYADQGNVPPHNIPAPTTGKKPYYLGLEESGYWNTNPAKDHDTAPASKRYYATKGAQSDTTPDRNPREVCPSFVEQMFGTETPTKTQEPNMWGFVQNYAGLKNNTNVGAVMECFTPGQLPAMTKLATTFSVCDRWFGSLPSETWPNRSFLHAGTSFGRLNNCDGKYTDDCVPNFAVYAGKRTIFDVLWDEDVRWAVYQDASVVGTLVSSQFWDIGQKLKWHAHYLHRLAEDLKAVRAPQYVFIEPSYAVNANDQHPPHDVLRGDRLIEAVYQIVRKSSVWHKTLLIITHDEHGGCYDHLPPPSAIAPDGHKPQFQVGQMEPFERLGPRVPALVVSPYVESGTVFRAPAAPEYDHTSILASLRDWIYGDDRDILGSNPRIKAAPTVWPVLILDVARTDCPTTLTPSSSKSAAKQSADAAVPVGLSHRQLVILAMGEADRILRQEETSGGGHPAETWTTRYEKLIEEKLAELEEMERSGELGAFIASLAGEAEASLPSSGIGG